MERTSVAIWLSAKWCCHGSKEIHKTSKACLCLVEGEGSHLHSFFGWLTADGRLGGWLCTQCRRHNTPLTIFGVYNSPGKISACLRACVEERETDGQTDRERQRHRERDTEKSQRQRQRQTDTERIRDRDRHRETETERHTESNSERERERVGEGERAIKNTGGAKIKV